MPRISWTGKHILAPRLRSEFYGKLGRREVGKLRDRPGMPRSLNIYGCIVLIPLEMASRNCFSDFTLLKSPAGSNERRCTFSTISESRGSENTSGRTPNEIEAFGLR